MKKNKHRLSYVCLSVLLMFSPTIGMMPAYAVTVSDSQNAAQKENVGSHADPNIDWNNWQERNYGTGLIDGPDSVLPFLEWDGSLTRYFSQSIGPVANDVRDEVTIPNINFGKSGQLYLRIPFFSIDQARLNSPLKLKNDNTGKVFDVTAKPTTIFGSQYNDYEIDTRNVEISPGESFTIEGSITCDNLTTANNANLRAQLFSNSTFGRVTKLVKVYYKNIVDGTDIIPHEELGTGMSIGTQVTGNAKEIPEYTFAGNTLLTPTTAIEGTDESISTSLMPGELLNHAASSIGEQAIVFWYEKQDHTAVQVHDSTIYTGDDWNAKENFVEATTSDGTSLTYSEFINQGGVVDSSALNKNVPGTYPVTYTINSVTSTANITVKENKQSIKGTDVTKYIGDSIPNDSEFNASATDRDGNQIDITIDKSQINMTQVGDYNVLLTAKDGQTKTVQVHVKEKQTAVNVHDSTIYVGDNWKAEDNFDSALDIDGNDVAFTDLTVDSSKVDASKAGTYEVSYTYDGVTSKATVIVKEKEVPSNESKVVVQYVDENGNKISKDTVLTGKEGDNYHTKAKDIKGYELTKTPKNKDGKFKKESVTITYLYKEKNAEESEIDQSGNSSTEHGKPSQKDYIKDNKKQIIFPKTGEKASVAAVIFGAGILLLVIATLFWRKTKDKD